MSCGWRWESKYGDPDDAKRALASPREDISGLENFAKLNDDLYRMAQPTREGFERLKEMGVRTVINLRVFHDDREKLEGLGMYYLRLPFWAYHVDEKIILDFLMVATDPKYQPVAVHCYRGSDRTGTVVAVYRQYVQGWERNEAMMELPRFHFYYIWFQLRHFLEDLDMADLRAKMRTAEMPEVELIE